MDDVEEVRMLSTVPESEAPADPVVTKASYVVPKRIEDRGPLSFACPTCESILIREMSEAYANVCDPIYCRTCKVWLRPATAK